MAGWAAFLDDGRIITSEEARPLDVPGFGLVLFAQASEDGGDRQIMHGWDFYYWHRASERWWGCNEWGLIDRLCHRLPTECVCLGRTIGSPAFQRMMADAARIDVPGIPRRAGA